MTLVVVASPLYGDAFGIAHMIVNGALIDMSYAPPPGTPLTIHFQIVTDDLFRTEMAFRAEVVALAAMIHGTRRVAVRFLEIVDNGESTGRWMH